MILKARKISFGITAASLLLLLSGCEGCKKSDNNTVTPTPNTSNAKTIACDSSVISTDTHLADRVDGANNVDYIVTCDVDITNGATLTIDPGVIIQFRGAGTGIYTESNGALVALGTAAKPIIFTSDVHSRGAWRGVYIGTSNPLNALSYVTIEYGGGTQSTYADQKAGLTVSRKASGGQVSVRNCTIDNNSGMGIWAGERQELSAFSDNKLTNNELSGISVYGNNLGMLDAGTDYATGNGQQYISIVGGGMNYTVTTDQTIVHQAIPYRVTASSVIIDAAELTIEPGVVMEFASGAGLRTYESDIPGASHAAGTISAIGTNSDHITFRGATNGKGVWGGIGFLSPSTANELQYCDISNGGLDCLYLPISGIAQGNVFVFNRFVSAQATIQHCSISSSSQWGIYRKSGYASDNAIINADAATSNTFSDCTLGTVN